MVLAREREEIEGKRRKWRGEREREEGRVGPESEEGREENQIFVSLPRP